MRVIYLHEGQVKTMRRPADDDRTIVERLLTEQGAKILSWEIDTPTPSYSRYDGFRRP